MVIRGGPASSNDSIKCQKMTKKWSKYRANKKKNREWLSTVRFLYFTREFSHLKHGDEKHNVFVFRLYFFHHFTRQIGNHCRYEYRISCVDVKFKDKLISRILKRTNVEMFCICVFFYHLFRTQFVRQDRCHCFSLIKFKSNSKREKN